MCDYSLDLVLSRPAKVGDKLITRKFATSISRGFAAIEEPNVAVCLRPGTEIAFEKAVEYENVLSRLPKRKVGQTVARFRRINENQTNTHHDALEFPDGDIVLLTRLHEGQRATVLQLPASARGVTEEASGQTQIIVAVG